MYNRRLQLPSKGTGCLVSSSCKLPCLHCLACRPQTARHYWSCLRNVLRTWDPRQSGICVCGLKYFGPTRYNFGPVRSVWINSRPEPGPNRPGRAGLARAGLYYVLTDKMTEDSYPELLKVLLTSCRHKLEWKRVQFIERDLLVNTQHITSHQ